MPDLAKSLERLLAWVEAQDYRGWDPHDALNAPLLRRLAGQGRLRRILCVQALRRLPFNLRPLLGVPRVHNAKGMGLFLASYLRLWQADPEATRLEKAAYLTNWLLENAWRGSEGAPRPLLGWGYPFDWPNRAFFAPAGTPTIVNTAFIGFAFLEMEQLLHLPAPLADALGRWGFVRPLEVARAACEFVLSLVPTDGADDEFCFAYTPLDRRRVHNANLLGAALLAETAAHTGEEELKQRALAAARFSLRRQRPDGSWPYGEGPGEGWVDNFHTGFVLCALQRIRQALDAPESALPLQRGFAYWKLKFLQDGVIPKYTPNQTTPVDVHCAAQAILTLLALGDPPRAAQVANWTVENMQEPEGWFDYQILPSGRIRIPYMRWGQAWMARALSELVPSLRQKLDDPNFPNITYKRDTD